MRRFFPALAIALFLGAVAFWRIAGEPMHHHKSAQEACPNGVTGSEQSEVEGGTPQDPDVHHFFNCSDGTKANAYD